MARRTRLRYHNGHFAAIQVEVGLLGLGIISEDSVTSTLSDNQSLSCISAARDIILPPMEKPDPFLEVRIQDLSAQPSVTGLCAGYENSDWRARQLARHLIEWLPEFALSYAERESLAFQNAIPLIAKAAHSVYTSIKPENRGEIGELLLHVAIRQVHNTIPAISKYYYKDSPNDTVKGFDAVHVICTEQDLELWLGEVKFYTQASVAIRDVVGEIEHHVERDYLRSEFVAITNKLDPEWPHAERLRGLLDRNRSLDLIFSRICIPVFLTYESDTVAQYDRVCAEFETKLREEIDQIYGQFCQKVQGQAIRIHLFVLPLKAKQLLVGEFDEALKACQQIANL